MALNVEQYLGKGIVFPIELTPSGLPIIRRGLELIKPSIRLILLWPYNQRIFLNEFGSRLEELLEEPNDELLIGLVEFFIHDALATWEKRITIMGVSIEKVLPERLDVKITYQIITTNFQDVLTFPFYRQIIT